MDIDCIKTDKKIKENTILLSMTIFEQWKE
jgi:hypothetical protein